MAGPGDEIAAAHAVLAAVTAIYAGTWLLAFFLPRTSEGDPMADPTWSWRPPWPTALCSSSPWGGSSPVGRIGALPVKHPSARQRPARADSSGRSAMVSSTSPRQFDAILPIRDRPARGRPISGAIAGTAARSAMPTLDPATMQAGEDHPTAYQA
jgi:hypothetical protein